MNKSINVFPDFENELKDLDARLAIVKNPNREGIANIKLDGIDVCPIPSGIIYDEPDPAYKIVAPNGWEMRHRSRTEALSVVHGILEQIKTPEGKELFYEK